MNCVTNGIFKMWIWWKMRLWKCEFCEKWDFENVNFVIIKISKMWILWKMRFWQCEFLDKLRIFAPVCLLVCLYFELSMKFDCLSLFFLPSSFVCPPHWPTTPLGMFPLGPITSWWNTVMAGICIAKSINNEVDYYQKVSFLPISCKYAGQCNTFTNEKSCIGISKHRIFS